MYDSHSGTYRSCNCETINEPLSTVYQEFEVSTRAATRTSGDDGGFISLLVGADFYWQIVGDQVVRGDGPTAVSSRIGYFLSGPLSAHTDSTSHVMDVIAAHVLDSTDHSRFWSI